MCSNIASLGKSFATDFAAIGSFSRVTAYVSLFHHSISLLNGINDKEMVVACRVEMK